MLDNQAAFDDLKFTFKSEEDPETHQKVELEFTAANFKKVEGCSAEALFKMAAFNKIEKSQNEAKVNLSIKYQVLCNETAIIGVLKQQDKATGSVSAMTNNKRCAGAYNNAWDCCRNFIISTS